ncbi:MAG: hypothetical protein AABZ60_19415 [Planctomycetota bacterium]
MSEEQKIQSIYQKLAQTYFEFPKELKKGWEKICGGNLVNMDRMKIVYEYLKSYEGLNSLEKMERSGPIGIIIYLRVAVETKKQFALTKEYVGDNEDAFCSALEIETELIKNLARFLNLPSQMTVADVLSSASPFYSEEEATIAMERFKNFFEEMDDPLHEESATATPEGTANVTKLVELLNKKVSK